MISSSSIIKLRDHVIRHSSEVLSAQHSNVYSLKLLVMMVHVDGNVLIHRHVALLQLAEVARHEFNRASI